MKYVEPLRLKPEQKATWDMAIRKVLRVLPPGSTPGDAGAELARSYLQRGPAGNIPADKQAK